MRGFAQGFVHGIARVFAQLGSHGQSSTSIARARRFVRPRASRRPQQMAKRTYWRYGTYATHITIYLHQSSHARRMMEVVHPTPWRWHSSAGCDGIGNSSYPVRPRRVEEVNISLILPRDRHFGALAMTRSPPISVGRSSSARTWRIPSPPRPFSCHVRTHMRLAPGTSSQQS